MGFAPIQAKMRLFGTTPVSLDPLPQTEGVTRKNRFSVSRMAGTMPVFRPHVDPASFAAEVNSIASNVAPAQKLGFKDFIDVINPLQHIPVVATLYRKATGDQINPAAELLGGAIFGGPLGAAAAMANVAIKGQTGRNIGERMMGLVDPDAAPAPEIILSRRKADAPRMAGTIPVWQGDRLNGETHFATLLQGLAGTPHIS